MVSCVCEESEFLLEARSRYVRNVLSHKDIGVGYDGVTSEFAILMPARYVGSNARDGGNGVEVGFLHDMWCSRRQNPRWISPG